MELRRGRQTDESKTFFRYLAYSEEDEKWRIVCTDAGRSEIGPLTVYPPNKDAHPRRFKTVAVGRVLNEYQIIYITKGSGSFESDAQVHGLDPGSVMFLFPGVRHVYKPDFAVGWTEHWVGFRGAYADNLLAHGFISPSRPVYEIGLQNRVLELFSKILDLARDQEPLYQIRAGSLILALVAEILACDRKAAQYSHSERLVQKAKFLMEENIYGEINLPAICESLGVSSSHLNEVFKSYTAMTPYQYYISIKLQKAKELLERSEPVIKEVAFRLGFKDEYYFSRLFKNKTGVTPSKWSAHPPMPGEGPAEPSSAM